MQVVVSEPEQQAEFVVIWMPGLGAGYEDMAGLAQAIQWPNQACRQVFLQAPDRPVTINAGMEMPAWYDIFNPPSQDYDGVNDSAQLIGSVIDKQLAQGIQSQNLYLAGFSQGGAMALYTALSTPEKVGGVVALSAYIPCADQLPQQAADTFPVFLGLGTLDPIVQPQWSYESRDHLKAKGFKNITLKEYPIEHAVSPAEVADVSAWFSQQLPGDNK